MRNFPAVVWCILAATAGANAFPAPDTLFLKNGVRVPGSIIGITPPRVRMYLKQFRQVSQVDLGQADSLWLAGRMYRGRLDTVLVPARPFDYKFSTLVIPDPAPVSPPPDRAIPESLYQARTPHDQIAQLDEEGKKAPYQGSIGFQINYFYHLDLTLPAYFIGKNEYGFFDMWNDSGVQQHHFAETRQPVSVPAFSLSLVHRRLIPYAAVSMDLVFGHRRALSLPTVGGRTVSATFTVVGIAVRACYLRRPKSRTFSWGPSLGVALLAPFLGGMDFYNGTGLDEPPAFITPAYSGLLGLQGIVGEWGRVTAEGVLSSTGVPAIFVSAGIQVPFD
jgi:hypothetical protein